MQEFHVVVYGATSFVGKIICRYLCDQYGANGDLAWAIAGRSREKLEKVRQDLGAEAAELQLMVADAFDHEALQAMCERTQVVLSVVGPYALYGEALVEACVQTGTDYVDLTGEVLWMKDMIEKFGPSAHANHARLVHCCGFDSIPSDLGVWHLQNLANQKSGQPCQRIRYRLKAAKGGVSGGTVASLLNVVKTVASDPSLRHVLGNPYALCDDDQAVATKQPEITWAQHDDHLDRWVGPFVMAGINTRVVHRSNQLLHYDYGQDFQYDEGVITGFGTKGWLRAQSLVAAMAGFITTVAVPPLRWALEAWILPKPGDGPSAETQKNGFFDVRLYGETHDGRMIQTKVTGDADPGYGSTAKMISEAAICLALDISKSEVSGGFWTPASALGSRLLERLESHGGMKFEEF